MSEAHSADDLSPTSQASALMVPADAKLYKAAKAGSVETIKEAIEEGGNIHSMARGGKTPLFVACVGDMTEAVLALLEAKSDANHRTDKGETCLHATLDDGTENELVVALMDAHASIRQVDKWGKNSLEVAQDRLREEDTDENKELVRILSEAMKEEDKRIAAKKAKANEIAGACIKAFDKGTDKRLDKPECQYLHWYIYSDLRGIQWTSLMRDFGRHKGGKTREIEILSLEIATMQTNMLALNRQMIGMRVKERKLLQQQHDELEEEHDNQVDKLKAMEEEDKALIASSETEELTLTDEDMAKWIFTLCAEEMAAVKYAAQMETFRVGQITTVQQVEIDLSAIPAQIKEIRDERANLQVQASVAEKDVSVVLGQLQAAAEQLPLLKQRLTMILTTLQNLMQTLQEAEAGLVKVVEKVKDHDEAPPKLAAQMETGEACKMKLVKFSGEVEGLVNTIGLQLEKTNAAIIRLGGKTKPAGTAHKSDRACCVALY